MTEPGKHYGEDIPPTEQGLRIIDFRNAVGSLDVYLPIKLWISGIGFIALKKEDVWINDTGVFIMVGS